MWSDEQKLQISFGPKRSKTNRKKLQSSLNPFAKERRDLNFWQVGVIFQGEFDGDAQNAPAFPKRGNHGSITKNLWKHFDKKNFWRRKMKRRESSETRFGKVWGRSEPSSGGQQRCEVLNAIRRVSIAVAFERRTSRFIAFAFERHGILQKMSSHGLV